MNKLIDKYAIHLDNLRRKYKITEQDLCEGICSARQYRRYMNGENDISHSKIAKFCDRLGISLPNFFYSFVDKDKEETAEVVKLYNLMNEKDYGRFFDYAKTIKKDRFYNVQNTRFFEFCMIKARYKSKKALPNETLDKLSELIDYPNCLTRNVYDFVDMAVLNTIAMIEVSYNQVKALDKLTEILKTNDFQFISYDSKFLLPSVYGNVSLFLGRLHRYEESLAIAEEGIKYQLKVNDISSLTHLLYMKAFCLMKLGFKEKSEIAAIRCLALVMAKENKLELNTFYRVLKKDFNIDPLDLITEYKSELLHLDELMD